ncbi:beta-alanine-activating enzyme beta-propeller domain-containing protein [Schlesneria paludicola]|uniref:beta-alanine-activating enzyme beta-propeller domain-containing protein n=1 Tax=Schlesneria paludicola TaxID=360056 RepID=UPI00029A068A|nr:PQQ-binding-like beta-propeller repeat protein [Schlesneria paludicola]
MRLRGLSRCSSSLKLLAAIVCATTAMSGSAAELSAPGKTSWASFRHDLAQTGVASSTLPDKLEKLWEVSIGDQIVATCAIVGDFVYVPCLSGELVCLKRATGEKVWGYKTVDKVDPNSFAPGFKSSPTVTANAVYLGDEDGVFHAIDRATGMGLWKFTTGGEIFSSAAVTEGRIIFGSYDNNLYCLNMDGKLNWKFATQGYVHCAPAIIDGVTFVAGCDEHLRTIEVNSGDQRAELKLETYLIASPAIVGDFLYVGTYASEVVAVNWKTQKVAWRYRSGNADFPFHSSAAVTEKLVVVGGRDKLIHAIDRETGKGVWTFATQAKVDSSPVIVGDRVFVGSNDKTLYELNLADGQERWRFSAGKPISGAPAVGEGVLVFGTESTEGKVYCFGKK